MGTDAGKVGLVKKSMYGTRDAASNWERDRDAGLTLTSYIAVLAHCHGLLYFFMKMESAPSVQAISEELITCVGVKEDRHQNIMSSVALKMGVGSLGALDNRESGEIH